MTFDDLFAAGAAAVMAASPVALFLFCVRPALRWLRARRLGHLVLAGCALLPAVVTIAGMRSPAALLLGWLATMAVIAAWLSPHWVVRGTGGPAEARSSLDQVLGWLFPAGRFLDVGDLQSAKAQVEEARRVSTPATSGYVDLWDKLVREEHMRRRGEYVSRADRLNEISAEYTRLVQAADPVRTPAAIVVVAVIALAAAASALPSLP